MQKYNEPDSKMIRDEKSNGQTSTMTAGLNQSGHLENQNQSHNTKKVAQGPNTKR